MSRGLRAGEAVATALHALAANRVRAALTVMGIVVGVATVTLMAAVIGGVRTATTEELDDLGPNGFTLDRYDLTGLRASGPAEGEAWGNNPPVSLEEAEMVGRLPAVASATPNLTATAEARRGSRVMADVEVDGVGAGWAAHRAGDFAAGRNFVAGEVAHAASVVVLSTGLAQALFGAADPVGGTVHLDGRPFEVVGVFAERPSLFTDGKSGWAVAPYSTAVRYLSPDQDWMQVQVAPAPGATQERAMDEVVAAMRAHRRLRPAQPDNFALTRQDAFRDFFDRTTRVFVVVLLSLSSVGLAVGGIGVVSLMTISVTERTREIGLRKALGATRGTILREFLAESVAVTLVGSAAGLMVGFLGAMLMSRLTPVPAVVPFNAAAAALGVMAVAGIGFGIYPALRAARLDPAVALAHE
ncbi:MAG: MacB-like periplasmic core domain protein [Gemmatimonadetes bacterium]|nr:MacB-like periplasmic core domain protein [Gemmatimonadota bacterium]